VFCTRKVHSVQICLLRMLKEYAVYMCCNTWFANATFDSASGVTKTFVSLCLQVESGAGSYVRRWVARRSLQWPWENGRKQRIPEENHVLWRGYILRFMEGKLTERNASGDENTLML
jgi:hypothetical protein